MKRFFAWLRNFFLPPEGSSTWRRVFPFLFMGLLTIFFLVAVTVTWEYTNSNSFCGTVCHTMPPQFSTYLASPHAGVDCVECHLGRASLPTQIVRKAEDGTLTFTSLISESYEYPLRAHNMRPANEACETCHYPAKFSLDSFREIIHYNSDVENTPNTTYLILKTGGGSEREGLGFGIHWHIENPVYFYAEDFEQQIIPYVRVVNPDGSFVEYVDLESDFDPSTINDEDLLTMDCITCHNRTSHLVRQPYEIVEQLLQRGQISGDIPNIRLNAVEALGAPYKTKDDAMVGLGALDSFYEENYPEFYVENSALITEAVAQLRSSYEQSVFPEQGLNWESHANNIGHDDFPGCFRCHGGQHFSADASSIRLECNICHSIPTVAGATDIVANIQVDRGPEPENHTNPNWITIHREIFNETCQSCHTVEDPGGVSNTSFCSNSACHGAAWDYAGFDAPGIREALAEQIAALATEVPVVEAGAEATYATLAPVFTAKCAGCHGEGGMAGLNLTSYQSVMAGSSTGPVVIPGDVENSRIMQVMTAEPPHPAQFTPEELDLLRAWIENGAPEN